MLATLHEGIADLATAADFLLGAAAAGTPAARRARPVGREESLPSDRVIEPHKDSAAVTYRRRRQA
ncbi:MAG: hypothetical protein ACLGI5_12645 [Thermoleophilia bacterium]